MAGLALAAVIPFACGPSEPSRSLKQSIEKLHLPSASHGGFAQDAEREELFTFGSVKAPELKPGQRAMRVVGPSFEAAVDGRSGALTVHSMETAKGFTLTPVKWPLLADRGFVSGSRVFFAHGDDAVIHTPVENGIKEDIVLTAERGDSLTAQWDLKLDEGLQARIDEEGSISIFETQRRDAPLYKLPAPVIFQNGGEKAKAFARYQLEGNTLTLEASGLLGLQYPVDIDPTVFVLTTSSDFAIAGNLEAGVNLDTTAQLIERQRNSKLFGSTQQLNTFPYKPAWYSDFSYGYTLTIYNGFAYLLGGSQSAAVNSTQNATAQVWSAVVNADGSLGPWVAQPAMPRARGLHGAAAYNGYLYAVGGLHAGTFRSEIDYAPINADGSLGAWSTSATTLPAGRASFGFAIANGYLYVVGGATSGTTFVGDTQVAAIQPGGDISAFSSTGGTNLPTARHELRAAAYNGYLYAVGGTDGATLSDVLVTTLSPTTGAISPWVAAPNAACMAIRGHGLVAQRGHLVMFGGINNSNQDISYGCAAPIGANGMPGTWTVPQFLSFGSFDHYALGGAAYNGNIYLAGGAAFNGSTNEVVSIVKASTAAPTLPDPLTTAYLPGGPPNSQLQCAGLAVYNGFVYQVGGNNAAATPTYSKAISYAPLPTDGSSSPTWTITGGATDTLVVPRCTVAVAHNGYLYALEGESGPSNAASNLLDYFKLDPLTGAPSARVSGSLPGPTRSDAAVVLYNGFIYLIGGKDTTGAALDDVVVIPLNADGSPGTPFDVSGVLTTARYGHSAAVYNGKIYVTGGVDSSGTLINDATYFPINADGSVSAGSSVYTTNNPAPRKFGAAVVTNGLFVQLGGLPQTGTTAPDVQWAPITATGDLGTFKNLTSQRANSYGAVTYFQADVFNGELVVGAGRNTINVSFASFGRLWTSSPFVLSKPGYTATSALATPREKACSVSANGIVYLIGGTSTGTDFLGDVRYKAVNSNGTLGAMTASTSALITPRHSHGCALVDGVVYVFGGYGLGGGVLSDIEYAPVLSNGDLGSFTSIANGLGAAVAEPAVATSGKTVYVAGGWDSVFASSVILTGTLNGASTAALTPSTASLPSPRRGASAVVLGSHLFVMGGRDASANAYFNDVISYAIGAGGALSAGVALPRMPFARANMGAVATPATVYLIGGVGPGNEQQKSTVYTNLLSSGSLGTWAFASTLAAARESAAVTAARGNIYVLGGDSATAPQTTVYYVGHGGGTYQSTYSKLVSFPSAVTSLDSITLNGLPAVAGSYSLTWKTATSAAGPWSSPTTVATVEPGASIPIASSNVKYLWFQVRFDDAVAQTLDGAQPESTLTDVTLTYTAPPPTKLVFSSPAQTFSAVANCSAAVVVSAQEANGIISGVTTATTVQLGSSAGTTQFFSDSSCTTPATSQTIAVNSSQATFYFKDSAAGSPTFTATATSGMTLTTATQTQTVAPGPAVSVGFSALASSYQAGQTIGGGTGYTLTIKDANGNTVPEARSIGVALQPAGTSLIGQVNCTTTAGTCTLSSNIQKAGTGYTLRATTSGLPNAISPAFDITPAAAAGLVWVTQPTNTTSMQAFTPALQVAMVDQYQNTVTSFTGDIVASLYDTAGNGGTLSGTLTVAAVNGVATFSDLKINKQGAYYLRATTAGFPFCLSSNFSILTGPAAQLAFTTGIFTRTASSSAWSTVQVAVTDAGGNIVSSATNSITLSLNNGGNGATLNGTLTATASGGYASYTTLSMTKAGSYTITATSGALTGTSPSFSITAATESALAFSTGFPVTVTAGQAITPTVTVAARDSFGNDVTTATGTVSLAFQSNPGGAILSNASATLSSGIATFPNLSIDKVATGYRVNATHSLYTATSGLFDVVAGPLSGLCFNALGNPTAGAAFTVRVRECDAGGNTINSGSDSITLAINTGPAGATLNGTLTVTATNGIADFTGLTLTKSGSYTLKATATGLPVATSPSFTINPAAAASMSFSTQPLSTYTAGATQTIRVSLFDTYGNATTTPNTTITLSLNANPGSDTLQPVSPSSLSQQSFSQSVLTFSTVLTKAATGYTVKATASPTLPQITTTAFNITPGAANKLVFGAVPPTVTAGQPITPGLTVMVADTYGNTVTTATNSVTLSFNKNPAGATLSGTLTRAAVNGVATFTGLSIDKSHANPYALDATASSLFNPGPVASADFTVVAGAPDHLVFKTSPTGLLAAGQDLAANGGLKVEVRDALDNVCTTATDSVTLSIVNNPGGGTLSGGTNPVAAVAGVANFTGLFINKAGTGYTLSAAATGRASATSAAFDIVPAALHHALFTVEPVSATAAGANITPAVVVGAVDLYDNVVKTTTGNVSVSLGTNPTGAVLTNGNGTVTLTNGVATFNFLSLTKAGVGYTLSASLSANSTTYSASSTPFSIVAGPKAKLQFKTQPPASVVSETLLTPDVEVQVNDQYDNLVASSADVVTLSLSTKPTGAVMAGTLAVSAVNGVATFSDLSLDKIGGYTLRATATGTAAALSSNVNVAAGPPYELAIIAPPPLTNAAGSAIPIVIGAQDHAHNPVTGAGNTVTVSLVANPGNAVLTGSPLSGSLTTGSATLQPVINKAANGYTLQATANPSLVPVTTSPFNVTAGAADRVSFVQNPTDAVAGAAISPAVTVAITDANGNALTTGSNAISVAIGTGSPNNGAALSGTTTVNAVNGVATFSNLAIDKVGSGYRLQASGAGIANGGTSLTFNITGGGPAGIFFPVATGSVGAGVCSGTPATVTIKDSAGNPTNTPTPVTITLSPATGLQLFSDSGCNTAATSVTVPANQQSAQFYFKATAANTYPVTATSPLGNATFNAVVSAGSAVKIAITTPSRMTTPANSCSQALSFQAADASDNVAPPTTPTQVTLSGGTQVTYYLDNICTQAVSFVTLNSSTPAATVYFKSTLAQAFTFNAAGGSLTAATQNEAVVAAVASKMVFSNNAPTAFAGSCSSARTLNVQDAYGNAQSPSSPLTVLLSSSSGGTFFSDAACGTALTNSSLVISSPATSGVFYYRHTVAGTPTVQASDASNTFLAVSESPTILPASAHHLAFQLQPTQSAAGQSIAGTPTVVVRDLYNNKVTTSAELIQVDLGTNTTGATLSGTLSANAAQGSAVFDMLSLDKPGSYTLVASAPNSTSIQTGTSATFTVTAGPVAQLAFGVQPSDVTAGANMAPAVTVRVTDALGNLVTNAGGQVTLSIAQNAAGGSLLSATLAPVSGVTINVVQGVATFSSLKLDKAGAGYTLLASRTNLQDVESNPFAVAPGSATQLTFSQVPSTGKAFAALGTIEVALADRFANLVENGSPVDVALDFANNPTNATMTGGGIQTTSGGKAQFTAVTIDKKGTGYTLLATSPGLSSATSAAITIGAADATKLAFKSARQTTVATGQCSNTVQFDTRDDGDNIAQLTKAATVSLRSTASTTKFYSDANCTTEVTTVDLAVGATGGSFFFKTMNGGPQTLTISATGLRPDQQIEDIVGDLPPTIAEQNASVFAGDTATFTVKEGTGRAPFKWELVDSPSGGSMDEFGHYTAGLVPTSETNKQDTIRVTDANGATGDAFVTVDPRPLDQIPLTERDPLNGWSCGCSAGSAAGSGGAGGLVPYLVVGLLFAAARTRKRTAPLALSRASTTLMVLAVLVPAVVNAGGAVDLPMPPPPVLKSKAKDTGATKVEPVKKVEAVKPVEEPPPVVQAPPPIYPRMKSVAVLAVEVTVQGEQLDGNAFSEMMTGAIDEPHLFHVISSKDVQTLLGIERQRQLTGCSEDESCTAEIASALGADLVLESSVGKVGNNYLVSARLVDAGKSKVISRASIQAQSANLLLNAVWRVAQEILDGYGGTLPTAEAQKWKDRPRTPPPAAMVEEDSAPSMLGITLLGVGGYQPASVPGKKASVGGEVTIGWRYKKLDLGVGGIVAPHPGARLGVSFAVLDSAGRLSLGVRGTAFPIDKVFGGGPFLTYEIPLGTIFAIVGQAAADAYPADGQFLVAALGGLGLSAHF